MRTIPSENKKSIRRLRYINKLDGKYYNRVETEREIPKLKLFIGKDKKRIRAPYEFLQEFQYGKETVQTTTSKHI